ncbi:MAG TPA: DNA double-strand break repair nuclease NurA [Candidatus Babeliales bacterium]|nr:DNA double-strand break repair nuclease NurA [Candidatus Babeliales bacterium]
MLNRSVLLGQLSKIQGQLFSDYSGEYSILAQAWEILSHDPDFQEKVSGSSQWSLPTWHEELHKTYAYNGDLKNYSVAAADGSQIYPDRHTGTLCSMINIGTVIADYNQPKSSVQLNSKPYVHLFEEKDWFEAIDVVNCRRQELEFKHALMQALTIERDERLVLFDGSLIFWHLENMDKKLHDLYLDRYLALLNHYHKKNILIAGYISMPKSKELVNLVRMQLSDFKPTTNDEHKQVDHMLDTHVAQTYLKPFERTILFANHSPIVKLYPEHLKPYFFYLHVDSEIVRIEVPQWIAQDSKSIDLIVGAICDQSQKGFGYPVVLSESHEQAVVKGPDRDFFYQTIYDLGQQQKQMIAFSLKQAKKRIVSV